MMSDIDIVKATSVRQVVKSVYHKCMIESLQVGNFMQTVQTFNSAVV